MNATAVVEKIPCLDIEFEVPIPSFDVKGMQNAHDVYGFLNFSFHLFFLNFNYFFFFIKFRFLIRNVKERFEKHEEMPVSINVEMRFLRGSGSPLSMQYNHQALYDSEEGQENLNKGFAAPEIVSNSPK